MKPALFLLLSFLGGFEPVIWLIISQSSGLVDLAQREEERITGIGPEKKKPRSPENLISSLRNLLS